MLYINRKQFAALSRSRRAYFEARVRRSVADAWPALARELGHDGLEAFVRRAIARAEGHGIAEEHDVFRFVNVTCALGEGFEEDPRYPWARVFLTEPHMSIRRRVNGLCDWTRREIARGNAGGAGAVP